MIENFLQEQPNGNGEEPTMSSREIATLTGKRHDHVMRDIDNLNVEYEKLDIPKIGDIYYLDSRNRRQREYRLTKMQTMDLMTGYNASLRIKVNRRWEELERKQQQIDFSDPNTVLMLAHNWKAEKDRADALQIELKKSEPLVMFANALQTSNHNILIGELAKILKQNGVDIGQNRLFDILREQSYIIKRGEQKNLPTQRAMELGLFEVKTTTINNPDGTVRVTRTPKVTPKRQQYFVNKFCGKTSLN